jgi:hypothetical protein
MVIDPSLSLVSPMVFSTPLHPPERKSLHLRAAAAERLALGPGRFLRVTPRELFRFLRALSALSRLLTQFHVELEGTCAPSGG